MKQPVCESVDVRGAIRAPALIGILVCCCAVGRVGFAGTPTAAVVEKVYDGLTLAQWRDRVRDVDPKSPLARASVSGLIEIIQDGNIPGRERDPFAALLGRIGQGASRAAPVLAEIINQRDATSQRDYLWAARALALMGSAAMEATPALVSLLFDDRIPVDHRQSPVEALARIGAAHPDAIPALVRLLQYRPTRVNASESAIMRRLAAEGLAIIGPDADVAAPLLIRAVRDPRETAAVRRNAVIALGALQTRGITAVPALCEALEFDHDEATRDAAADALAKIGGLGVSTMARYLTHDDNEVRWRVAQSLRQVTSRPPPELVLRNLSAALTDKSDLVQVCAAESYWLLLGPSELVVTTAIQLLTSPHREIRFRATQLLVDLQPRDPGHLDRIRALQDHPQNYVRKTAAIALRKLYPSDQPATPGRTTTLGPE